MQKIDLKTMTIEELKSLAYDQIVLLEQTKTNLNLIQQEIANKGEKQDGTN